MFLSSLFFTTHVSGLFVKYVRSYCYFFVWHIGLDLELHPGNKLDSSVAKEDH
jgi:hypothetical protein